jgi:hypothetical protein
MTKIVVIGDVHGKTTSYQKMLRQKYDDVRTIQCGDMGIGFSGVGLHAMTDNHKWFRGNHDCPEKCRENPNYLGDYGFLPDDNLFWLAGAFSIDRQWRTENVSWWPDEELSYLELQEAIALYEKEKPKYVISHEAPENAAKFMLLALQGAYFAAKLECSMSRTSRALQTMLDIHQPDEWVFGHYHVDKTFYLPNCRTKFTCVAELHTYDLETKNEQIEETGEKE